METAKCYLSICHSATSIENEDNITSLKLLFYLDLKELYSSITVSYLTCINFEIEISTILDNVNT